MFYSCSNCGFYIPQAKTCMIKHQIMQGRIKPDEVCSKYCSEPYICDKCGQVVLWPIIEVDAENNAHIYCERCFT